MDNTKTYKELFLHFFIYGFGSIAQALSSFLLLPLITSKLTTNDYGVYNLVNVIGIMAGTVFYLGISSAFPRSYFDSSDPQKRKGVFSTAFYLTFIGALVQILFFYVFKHEISWLIFDTDKYHNEIAFMSIATAVAFLNTFFFTYLRVQNKSIHFVALGITAALTNMLTVYYVFTLSPESIWAPIIGYLCGQLIVLIAAVLISVNSFVWVFNTYEAKLLLSYGTSTVFASFAVMGIEWANRFFINNYLTLTDVGIYSLICKIGALINVVYIAPFNQIWNPMSIKYRENDNIKDLHTKVLFYYYLVGSAVIVLLTVAANELMQIFIDKQLYVNNLFVSPFIMIGILIYGSINILTVGFIYHRKMRINTILFFVIAIANLIFNFVLIEPFGFLGAAISSFLTYALAPVLIYYYSRKYFSFEIELKKIVSLIALTAFTLAVFFIADKNFSTIPKLILKISLIPMFLTCLVAFLSNREKDKLKYYLRFNIKKELSPAKVVEK